MSASLSWEALRQHAAKYRQLVVKQPLVLAEVESAIRWASYLAAGEPLTLLLLLHPDSASSFSTATKYNKTHVLSEFLYSSSNLLQLLNDSILRAAGSVKIDVPAAVVHLQTLLQVLEYTSVLAEFGANVYAPKLGKWIIIACFQVAKAVIKLLLLLKYNRGLQLANPLLPLDRRVVLIESQRTAVKNPAAPEPEASPSEDKEAGGTVVTLKRSGRVMRTLDQAPARDKRTWLLPTGDPRFKQLLDRTRRDAPPSSLTQHQTLAEVLHILRPVAHLACLGAFGSAAWTPFLVSLSMDLTSLKLLHEPHDKAWNMNESIELGQRSFSLLLYILRSPLYDQYTKQKILRMLSMLANRIPLFGRLITPMLSYLPEWQKTYFYVWTS